MRRHLFFGLGFLLLIYSLKGTSQSIEAHFFSRYTQNDGLSSFNTRYITQDAKGFLWVATQDGLNLFDGKTFSKYTENSEPDKRLAGTDIHWLITDTLRHLIWVLNPEMTINAINYQTGRVIKTINGTRTNNDDWAVSMALDNNRLWISCMNGIKVYNIQTQMWERAPNIPFKKNQSDDLFSVRNIYADAKGLIWAFVNHYGIIIIDAKTKAIIKIIENREFVPDADASQLVFTCAVNLTADELLIGTSAGLKKVSYNNQLKFRIYNAVKTPIPALASDKIDAILKTTDGSIYIAGNANLYKLDNRLLNGVKIKESNITDAETWLNSINNLYADPAGNLWLACRQGLAMMSAAPSAFASFNNRNHNEPGLTHLYNVFPVSRGKIIIGQEKSLMQYDSNSNKFLQVSTTGTFYYSFTDFKKRIIVSADNGLFVLINNQLIGIDHYYPELKSVASYNINSTVNLGDSVYVVGCGNDRGMFLWNYKRKTLRIINNNSYPINLKSNIVKKIFCDSSGRIWVLSVFGIDILEKDFSTVRHISVKNPFTGSPMRLYFDICEVNGNFWLANYSFGIIEIDANGKLLKALTTDNGLCDDGVYKIFKTGSNNLIITSNNGISVYDIKNSNFTNYYEQDGLHSNSFEENCGIEKDGKIYAGGLNGFTIIDPKLLFVNKRPPQLYFTDIKIDAKSNNTTVRDLNIKELVVPEDALQTTVSFSGLNYSNPGRVLYRYKIDELNSNWIDLGKQNFVNIIGINPGKYHLLVESSNENSVWNKKPIMLLMHFLPRWYQTWWFNLTVVILICSILYALYLYRISQIKVQQKIRKDIASDLHDDLGSSLNSIKIFTHLAIEKQQNIGYLNEIEKLITNTAVGLRDMLWVLENSRDNVTELVERIKNFALPIAVANQITIDFFIDPLLEQQEISKTEKRNLLLIGKEAINNCFKHANCSTIKITIKPSDKGKLIMSITDNGKGFDVSNKSDGYGMNNIKYRAKQINYLLDYSSSPGNGTSIVLKKNR